MYAIYLLFKLNKMALERVLVTGISGYLGLNVADQLIKANYKVRGTVRSLKDEKKVKPILDLSSEIELVEADLMNKDSWINAVNGCDVVLHVASPLPIEAPTDEKQVLEPAINGTLNVLEACYNDKKIRRVVVTSSGLAVMGADYKNDITYDETYWGDPNTNFTYCKSKILSERAAWNFVKEKMGECFELVVINPTFILGPVLHNTLSVSSSRMLNILGNKIEKVPQLYFPTCDVRDVALAHVKAVFTPEAAGERILIISSTNFIPMIRWAQILDKEFTSKGYKIPLEEVETGEAKGKTAKVNDSKMRNILGIKPIEFEKTVIDMAYSLINKDFL